MSMCTCTAGLETNASSLAQRWWESCRTSHIAPPSSPVWLVCFSLRMLIMNFYFSKCVQKCILKSFHEEISNFVSFSTEPSVGKFYWLKLQSAKQRTAQVSQVTWSTGLSPIDLIISSWLRKGPIRSSSHKVSVRFWFLSIMAETECGSTCLAWQTESPHPKRL